MFTQAEKFKVLSPALAKDKVKALVKTVVYWGKPDSASIEVWSRCVLAMGCASTGLYTCVPLLGAAYGCARQQLLAAVTAEGLHRLLPNLGSLPESDALPERL